MLFSEIPLKIGHRGAAALAPENTMESIRLAFDELNVPMVEFDIHLSQDGVPVIIHDPTLQRTTNGAGYVSRWKYEDLQKLDAGFWFDPEQNQSYPFRGKGLKIPSFETLLKTYGHKLLFAEIKEKSAEAVNRVVELIRKDKAEERCAVGSEHDAVSKTMRENYPDIYRIFSKKELAWSYFDFKTNLLKLKKEPRAVASMPLRNCGMDFSDEKFIAYLHRREIRTFFWTINDPKLIQTLFNRKADGIITDNPKLFTF